MWIYKLVQALVDKGEKPPLPEGEVQRLSASYTTCKNRYLQTYSDLTADDLPMLENIRDRSLATIREKYGVRPDQIRAYFHYQPLFFHLHVHFNLPQEVAVVFVVATTGQGEIPPNMRNNWRRLLKRSLSSTCLQNVNFAVFGLGESSYQKYNYASKKVYRRLLQVGGKNLVNLGLADDQHELGIDGALIPWKKEFWDALRASDLFPRMKKEIDPDSVLPPKYRLVFGEVDGHVSTVDSQWHQVTVIANERVTSDNHFQDTRLVSLNIDDIPSKPGSDLKFDPGDVLMVQPRNHSETIQIALDALKYSDELLHRPFRLEPSE